MISSLNNVGPGSDLIAAIIFRCVNHLYVRNTTEHCASVFAGLKDLCSKNFFTILRFTQDKRGHRGRNRKDIDYVQPMYQCAYVVKIFCAIGKDCNQ